MDEGILCVCCSRLMDLSAFLEAALQDFSPAQAGAKLACVWFRCAGCNKLFAAWRVDENGDRWNLYLATPDSGTALLRGAKRV